MAKDRAEELRFFWRQFIVNAKRFRIRNLRKSLIEIAISWAFGLGLGYGYNHASVAYSESVKAIGEHPTQAIIALVAILCGLAAWVFKHNNLIYYGVYETMFGAASAFAIAFNIGPTTTLAQLSSLVGCAYVIARGIGNISEGQAKEKLGVKA